MKVCLNAGGLLTGKYHYEDKEASQPAGRFFGNSWAAAYRDRWGEIILKKFVLVNVVHEHCLALRFLGLITKSPWWAFFCQVLEGESFPGYWSGLEDLGCSVWFTETNSDLCCYALDVPPLQTSGIFCEKINYVDNIKNLHSEALLCILDLIDAQRAQP